MGLLFSILLIFLFLALLVYTLHLRKEQATLQRELRRVLRAGAGAVEARDVELQWRDAVCDMVPVAVVVTDRAKRILFGNTQARSLFGQIEPGEAAIERLRHHHLEALLDHVLRGEMPEPELITFKGKQWLVLAHGWPHNSHAVGGAFLVLQDITQLNQLRRARRDMAANLSHELRTPLTSIKLISESLLGGAIEQPEMVQKLVTRIASENEALIRLLEDLTALSAIESGRVPLRLETVNLRELVERRLHRLAPQLAERQLQLSLDAPDTAEVMLDPERFGQVLTNLLDNTIKFSPEGGTIFVRIEECDTHTALVIRDEGPGILPKDLPRIFERFYKGDRVRTRTQAAGTGLGLAIVKHLVEAHGGAIAVESEPDQGATFTTTLPHA